MHIVVTPIHINAAEEVVDDVKALITPELMLNVHEVFADMIDPWTPFLTGRLSGDITIDSEGVTYNVPYARDKYYGEAYTHTVHPLATSYWDEVAMETQMEAFTQKVKELILERAKEVYG